MQSSLIWESSPSVNQHKKQESTVLSNLGEQSSSISINTKNKKGCIQSLQIWESSPPLNHSIQKKKRAQSSLIWESSPPLYLSVQNKRSHAVLFNLGINTPVVKLTILAINFVENAYKRSTALNSLN
jgi:hypothetical protein